MKKTYPEIIKCKTCGLKNKDCFYFKPSGRINGYDCKDCVKLKSSNTYKLADKDILKAYKRKLDNEKRHSDPAFKLRMNVSKAIYSILKKRGSSKQGKSIVDKVPFTFEQLVSYLESLFEPWMSWENHGQYKLETWDDNDPSTWKWNLDHIVPHSNFKYISMDEDIFKQCWDLSNLRPLSAKQNIIDGAR